MTAVHTQTGTPTSAPRIHAVLRPEETVCGRRRIARLMRAAGLTGRHRRRRHRTTNPDPHADAPDLVPRNFRPGPTATHARWSADITSTPTDEGRLYPATVTDSASRQETGWATADHPRTELTADAPRTACHQHRPRRPCDLPARPRPPIHQPPIHPDHKPVGCPAIRRPHRPTPGQPRWPNHPSPPRRTSGVPRNRGMPSPFDHRLVPALSAGDQPAARCIDHERC
ncbi:IS3 family transposase [Streptomyces sp. NPDC007205]|uniref:IS3 family transposase n=1 Tax=Streptomyces sp. NPDC007205 TaxID=3154316 RepID=UPI0033D63A57